MTNDVSFISDAMKHAVPWVSTAGIEFLDVAPDRVTVSLPDRQENRNHVGGPHAAAMFGAGETASGAVAMAAFAEHLGEATPLVAHAEITYRKLALGSLQAEATLGRSTNDVIDELRSGNRPEFPVHVKITNAEGVTTGELTVTWTLRPNQ